MGLEASPIFAVGISRPILSARSLALKKVHNLLRSGRSGESDDTGAAKLLERPQDVLLAPRSPID